MNAKQWLRIEAWVVCCFILLGLAAERALAVMRKFSTQELANRAQWIVLGQVSRIHSEWNVEHTMIYSYSTISVQDWIKGNPQGTSVAVRTEGGEVGTFACYVSDEPCFTAGETVLLFLEPEPECPGTLKVAGLLADLHVPAERTFIVGHHGDLPAVVAEAAEAVMTGAMSMDGGSAGVFTQFSTAPGPRQIGSPAERQHPSNPETPCPAGSRPT